MTRPLYLVFLLCFGLAACANAETPELNLTALAHLRSQAIHAADIDIDLDALPLRLAAWLGDDHDTAEVRSALSALHTVRVRHYEFASDYAYSKADVDAVREQLSGPGWSRVAQIHNEKESEDVDIYLAADRQRIKGVVILTSEPREVTIVNAVGSLDPKQVAALRRQFDLDHALVHDAAGSAVKPLLPF